MDDFKISSLQESRNEWVSRLVNILTPFITDGFKSIFTDSYKLCVENDEEDKYLMTFQNFLARVPKWNDELINVEVARIKENSNCTYIEDLITCVHVVQLKALTCVRVGQKQKKIDIDIPKLKDFVHKVYIHVARKVYTNVYLFEKDIAPLDLQKNNRELELIVRECILNSVRDSIPIEDILRSYLEETEEEEVVEEEPVAIKLKTDNKVEIKNDGNNLKLDINELPTTTETKTKSPVPSPTPSLTTATATEKPKEETTTTTESLEPETTTTSDLPILKVETEEKQPSTLGTAIKFSNYDKAVSVDNKEEINVVPKTTENLEKISDMRHEQRKAEELAEEDDGDTLKIMDDANIDLGVEALDITTL